MESKLKMMILILVIFAVFNSCWALNKEKGKQRNAYGKESSTYERNLKNSLQVQTCFCTDVVGYWAVLWCPFLVYEITK